MKKTFAIAILSFVLETVATAQVNEGSTLVAVPPATPSSATPHTLEPSKQDPNTLTSVETAATPALPPVKSKSKLGPGATLQSKESEAIKLNLKKSKMTTVPLEEPIKLKLKDRPLPEAPKSFE